MYMLLLGIMIIVSVTLVVYSLVSNRGEKRFALKQRLKEKILRSTGSQQESNSAAGKLIKKAAPIFAKPVKPKTDTQQSRLKIRLANAGFRRENIAVLFLASKTVLAGVMLVLSLVIAAGSGYPPAKVFGIVSVAAGLGFMLPDIWLYLASKSRAEAIRNSLPDCLDLLVVCVEAGLGLDVAIQRVSAEMVKVHPELSEEFMLANMEIQMGITRAEALTNLGIRTAVSELNSLSAILIQAERFGTSIATALRVHADALRLKRRQAAEERAAKTAVKLIIPLIFFIFPAIFIVLTGPAALNLYRTFTTGVLSK